MEGRVYCTLPFEKIANLNMAGVTTHLITYSGLVRKTMAFVFFPSNCDSLDEVVSYKIAQRPGSCGSKHGELQPMLTTTGMYRFWYLLTNGLRYPYFEQPASGCPMEILRLGFFFLRQSSLIDEQVENLRRRQPMGTIQKKEFTLLVSWSHWFRSLRMHVVKQLSVNGTGISRKVMTSWSSNRPFPSSPQPPFQSEAKCEVWKWRMIIAVNFPI